MLVLEWSITRVKSRILEYSKILFLIFTSFSYIIRFFSFTRVKNTRVFLPTLILISFRKPLKHSFLNFLLKAFALSYSKALNITYMTMLTRLLSNKFYYLNFLILRNNLYLNLFKKLYLLHKLFKKKFLI